MGLVEFSTKIVKTYPFLAGCMLLTSACEGLFRDVPSNCNVIGNSLSREQGFEVIHEQPNRCPVSVPFDVAARGGIPTTFEGLVTAPEDVPVRFSDGTQLVRIRFFDDNEDRKSVV